MKGPRKSYSAEFKAKVSVEAIRGQKTTNEVATAFGVHPNQVAARTRRAR